MFSSIRTEYGDLRGKSVSVFSSNTGKYGPENTLYLDSLHAVLLFKASAFSESFCSRKHYALDMSFLMQFGTRVT